MSVPGQLAASVTGQPRPSVVPVLAGILVLAGLDIFGAVLARAWSDHRSVVSLLAGMTLSALLFVVYGKSLDYAALSTVTIGWVVMVQVGVVVLDALGGASLPPTKLAAIGLMLLLQAYVIVGDVLSS